MTMYQSTYERVRPAIANSASRAGLDDLCSMLSFRRPHGSDSESQFIREFIAPTGARPDGFGNMRLRIGDAPILWSAHTDSVHRFDGYQRLRIDAEKGTVKVDQARTFLSNCLGADDATGCWILIEMAKAKIPGLYIWHRKEESGGHGARWIVRNDKAALAGMKCAIAFDRMNYDDVIDSQGGRCASLSWAKTLGEEIGGMTPAFGVYTDTAEYKGIIPECTNLSVGYFGQHTETERQDLIFAGWLRDRMVTINLETILSAVKREPAKDRWAHAPNAWDGWQGDWSGYGLPDRYKSKAGSKKAAKVAGKAVTVWGGGYAGARAGTGAQPAYRRDAIGIARSYGNDDAAGIAALFRTYPTTAAAAAAELGLDAKALARVIDEYWSGIDFA